MLAATKGLTEIVSLLVEEGADVNQINAVSFLCYFVQLIYGFNLLYMSSLCFLFSLQVDGNTALHYASLFGQSETVKFLIEHCHADTSIINKVFIKPPIPPTRSVLIALTHAKGKSFRTGAGVHRGNESCIFAW